MPREMKTVNLTASMIDQRELEAGVGPSVERMQELDNRFRDLQQAIRDAHQKRRLAEAAVAEHQIAHQTAIKLQNEFLYFAGNHCEDVASWNFWPLPPRKDVNGDILLETPISQDDMRRQAQVLNTQLNTAADNVLRQQRRNPSENYDDMFGGNDPDPNQ